MTMGVPPGGVPESLPELGHGEGRRASCCVGVKSAPALRFRVVGEGPSGFLACRADRPGSRAGLQETWSE